MPPRFFHRASENHQSESLQMLRDWVIEESEEGLKAKGKQKEEDRRKNHAFTTLKLRCQEHPQKCDLGEGSHGVWACPQFRDANVEERGRIAKDQRLCFRCLSKSHQGKN